MIDAKLIRSDPDGVRQALKRRGADEAVDAFLELDAERRRLLGAVEQSRADANAAAKEIGRAKQAGDDTAIAIARQAQLKHQTAADEAQLSEVESRLRELMVGIPNLPDPTAADGLEEEDAETIRTWGEKPEFDFEPKDHYDLCGPDGLGLIDTEAAARVSGSRSALPAGRPGAARVRLVQWAIEKLVGNGHTPVIPPVLVREEAMIGTGFFPEARSQVHERRQRRPCSWSAPRRCRWPRSTAAGCSPRRAAGLLRRLLHLLPPGGGRRRQGHAGDLPRPPVRQGGDVRLLHARALEQEHDRILAIEEEIAQELGFHYRVQNIAVGDLGASAAKKYDIEVWLPGQQRYRELTSCSNCTDYQARRLDTASAPRPACGTCTC